jgi:predicted Zn-dependent protease
VSATEIVERALAEAGSASRHAGTSVIVTESSSAELRWAGTTLTTNGTTTGQAVTVATAVHGDGGTSVGVVTRRGVAAADVADLVAQARAVAEASPPAEDAAALVDGGADVDWAEPSLPTGPHALEEVATGLGQAFDAARSAGQELFGYAEQTAHTTWLGTSAGTRRRHVQPTGTVELTGKSHERSRSAFASRAARDLALVDMGALAAEVSERLGWQARRLEVEPGPWDTVLPPTAVADLLVDLYWSTESRAAHEGRTAFARAGGGTRVGERLTDVPFTLRSDPAHPGLECEPFVATPSSHDFASVFDNGMAVPAATWVDRGTLAALPTTRFSAGLTGLPVTPAVDNLVAEVDGGQGDAASLVAGLERGLLLTCLWYIREVDPRTLLLTGLTRDGVYLVEGGEVVGAVTNFRFNESPLDMLRRVDGAGASVPALSREWSEFLPRTAMPPLLVRGFNMSSTSPAS